METKTYYADDMPTAMEQIKRELGADAIIVKSRKVRQKSGLLGLFRKTVYEVVVSCEQQMPPVRQGEGVKTLDFGTFGMNPPQRRATASAPAGKPAAADGEKKSAELPKEPGTATAPVEPERFAQLVRMCGDTVDELEQERDMLKILSGDQVAPQAAVSTAAKIGAYAAARDGEARGTEQAVPAAQQTQASIVTAVASGPVATAEREPASLQAAPEPDAAAQPQRRGRGRPRKHPLPEGAAAPQPKREVPPQDDATMARLDTLERMIRELAEKLAARGGAAPAEAPPQTRQEQSGDGIEPFLDRLAEQDVDAEALRAVRAGAEEYRKENPGATDGEAVAGALQGILGKPRQIRMAKHRPRCIMFVGATGVGKTTTLVKLASACVFDRHAKIGIVNADMFRVGAQDQLSVYAGILNVPVATIYSAEELPEAIRTLSDCDFIFIDTGGKAPHDPEYQAELIRLIALGGIQETYLTISATTSPRVCRQIIQEYEGIGDYRLIVTKLDESGTFGALVNLCHASGRPLSYITVGQNVPDDIQRVEPQRLIEQLLAR